MDIHTPGAHKCDCQQAHGDIFLKDADKRALLSRCGQAMEESCEEFVAILEKHIAMSEGAALSIQGHPLGCQMKVHRSASICAFAVPGMPTSGRIQVK